MKRLILFTLLCSALGSTAQNFGVGLRLGDPSGLTLKKYMGSTALEFNIGRTHTLQGPRWYDDRFDVWYDDQHFNYSRFEYQGYRASVPLGMQLHYLFRKGINTVADQNTGGLEWYFGFGGQLRFQQYYYDYRYKIEGDPNWYYANGARVVDLDVGVDGVIGLEYRFREVPLSVFLDGTLFMEVADDPFLFWLQGGTGIRYNF